MTNFLKNNAIILIFIVGTYLAEVGHLAFEHLAFGKGLQLSTILTSEGFKLIVNFDNWSDPVYYLTNQILAVTFIPAIVYFIAIGAENKASKSMAFGLVVWNLKEIADEIGYMCGANLNVFEINASFWRQTVFMFSVVAFSAYGYSKWKY